MWGLITGYCHAPPWPVPPEPHHTHTHTDVRLQHNASITLPCMMTWNTLQNSHLQAGRDSMLTARCRQGDVQCCALSTQTTQDSPSAEPRRSKRKLRQIFGIKLNRQLILFQTHRLVTGTQASEPNTIKPDPDLLEG